MNPAGAVMVTMVGTTRAESSSGVSGTTGAGGGGRDDGDRCGLDRSRSQGGRCDQRETTEAGCENDGRPQAASARTFGHPAVRPAGVMPSSRER